MKFQVLSFFFSASLLTDVVFYLTFITDYIIYNMSTMKEVPSSIPEKILIQKYLYKYICIYAYNIPAVEIYDKNYLNTMY